ncbi:DUF2635 domain-containing protein [Yokenella regensburgei]|uniref:DUF2635 domain-containing protein n=1 Tax=Yokenella regensburgei TaxID=158877 RepID=UPI0013756064|nr:DUF2635 domain-containing protein [Yokenella regensburgei]KAF1366464.1 hypothetical protein FHR25_005046 [Yokenella regensburgei]
MIKVIARQGIRVPVEGNPARYITDETAETVANTAYWRRRLKDGDLLIFTDTSGAPAEAPADDAAEKPATTVAKANK